MDVLATNAGEAPNLYRNDGGNANNWLRLRTVGTKSNRDGIGARVTISAGGRTQMQEVRAQSSFLSTNDPRPLFGLGQTAGVEKVEVRWPSGQVDTVGPVEANRTITVVEGKGIQKEEVRK